MAGGELLLTVCRGAGDGGTSSPPSPPPASSSSSRSRCCLLVFHLEWALFRPGVGDGWAEDEVEEDGSVGWSVVVGVGVEVDGGMVALDSAGLFLSILFSGFT